MEQVKDINKRKGAEGILQDVRDKVQGCQDIIEVMLLALDEKGEITLINRKGCEVLGYDERELMGKNWFDMCLPAEGCEAVRTVFQRLLAGEVEPVEYYENPILTKSGDERIIAWHNSVLRDEAGNIIGTLSSGEDITDRKLAEEALKEVNCKLQAALKAKDEMIQNVSHELRTPLTIIMGYVEMLSGGFLGPLTAEQREALNIVARNSNRLHTVVNRLLLLQTFDPEVLQKDRVDLVPFLARVVQDWQPHAVEAGLSLRLKAAADLPPVMADPEFMSPVMDSLIENALKFSRGKGLIEIKVWEDRKELFIAVADQGIGMAQDQVEQVFERFYQVDGSTSRRYGGMGVGLALCKAVVDAHGGRIWAESEGEGRGSTFYVALPVANRQIND